MRQNRLTLDATTSTAEDDQNEGQDEHNASTDTGDYDDRLQ